MRRLARRPVIAFPQWVTVALACALANPFCCHLLPLFDGFVISQPAQIDEVQPLCAGKPLKPISVAVPLAANRVEFLVAVLSCGGVALSESVMERPVPARKLRGPPRHLVLGILRI